jgi:Ca2+-binding EF-hand superfamily protein
MHEFHQHEERLIRNSSATGTPAMMMEQGKQERPVSARVKRLCCYHRELRERWPRGFRSARAVLLILLTNAVGAVVFRLAEKPRQGPPTLMQSVTAAIARPPPLHTRTFSRPSHAQAMDGSRCLGMQCSGCCWGGGGASAAAAWAIHEQTWCLRDRSVYFAVVSVTTVGYGDFHPTSPADKLIFTLYILGGTVTVAFSLSVLIEVALNLEGEKRQQEVQALLDHISHEQFEHVDHDGDGHLSESEFVIWKLQQMGKVSARDVSMARARFREVDVDGDGKLTVHEATSPHLHDATSRSLVG